jgi:hypothetical protein
MYTAYLTAVYAHHTQKPVVISQGGAAFNLLP